MMLVKVLTAIVLLSIALASWLPNMATADQPNVLLIAIDDLNDWVGCLGGHPQAETPNLDALAGRGTLFVNAHCQAPVCMPSRASLMTSRIPSSTGLYFLNPGIRDSPLTRDAITLPERFAAEGYDVMGAGKLFHHRMNREVFSKVGTYATFDQVQMGFGPRPKTKISQPHGHPLWDWGAFPDRDDQLPDYHLALWAANRLKNIDGEHQPFFLAVGFYRPHVPMYVSAQWFDRHPRAKIRLPLITADDVEDLSTYATDLTSLNHVAPTHKWVESSGQWPHAVQAYLASTTFVDHCVGTVISALDSNPARNNTIVVLFSDHGFHLGEKRRWAKRSLWEDATRVPLVFAGPGIDSGSVCKKPAGLIDIYPTLLELCNIESDPTHQGVSLRPLLENVESPWNRPAITSFGPGNHAVRSERWRFIQYADGTQELYDHDADPHEWNNLADLERYAEVIATHSKWLPADEHKILGTGSTGHKAYLAAELKLKKK